MNDNALDDVVAKLLEGAYLDVHKAITHPPKEKSYTLFTDDDYKHKPHELERKMNRRKAILKLAKIGAIAAAGGTVGYLVHKGRNKAK